MNHNYFFGFSKIPKRRWERAFGKKMKPCKVDHQKVSSLDALGVKISEEADITTHADKETKLLNIKTGEVKSVIQ